MTKLTDEVKKRRTFAIISHPDAGKTTITEQMLLFGGVIRSAGTVKARKSGHYATSDWMAIEKKRGISVTSSVMQFEYQGKRINILDTPGHQDFSEDTYRTLMAVDAAVMVIDSLDLIAELEDLLGIEGVAMNWPIGMGKQLKGLYDIDNNRVELYRKDDDDRYLPLDKDGKLAEDEPLAKDSLYQSTLDDIDLLKEAGNTFDKEKILKGDQTPVFFGSALTNFGVETFLDSFVNLAPAPQEHTVNENEKLAADDPEFSGFVFKIQANMNPNHRDRIAFVRIGSGEFKKGIDVTLARTGKPVRLNNATEFMSSERVQVSDAVAGDIVGLYDTGNFQIGDSIYAGKKKIVYPALPQFTPEIFMRVTPKNVMKQKSFHKGMNQLVQEGAIQLYRGYSTDDYILGAVGQLQFEVFSFRMKNEYNSEVELHTLGNRVARWINPDQLDPKMSSSRNLLVKDRDGEPLFLFENAFAERWFKDKYPDVELTSRL